jgi:hypothetical protein
LFPHREHIHTGIYRAIGGDMGPGENAIVVAGVGALRGPGMHFELERTIISSAEPPPHMLEIIRVAGDPIATLNAAKLPADVGFASPFLATVPGTDTYTEDL